MGRMRVYMVSLRGLRPSEYEADRPYEYRAVGPIELLRRMSRQAELSEASSQLASLVIDTGQWKLEC
jgi:hypothetical protein